jgi:hypothetical protein
MFETVSQGALVKYCSANPLYYSNVRQTVPNSQIPDEDWYQVTGREIDDPWTQYENLKKWADEDREFVRNVRVEQQVAAPQWELVERA